MSQPENNSSWLRPWGLLLGFVAGLVICAGLGRSLSSRDYHRDFVRFHMRISPEAHYYPTMDEMRAIVRARCRPDQVLVIVGGNSIFFGVGQPLGKLWTEELQRQLGPGYCVVNFALRGSLCTDGGALVAESLREEFPRQIYVANTSPFAEPAPFGMEPYRYLFREALARGLLMPFEPRLKEWQDYARGAYSFGERVERGSADQLDRALRYRDLWNWVGYNWLFTIPNPVTPQLPQATWPRSRFLDEENDFDAVPPSQRFPLAVRDAEMAIVRAFSGVHTERDAQGNWIVREISRQSFLRVARLAFPDPLKRRTLIVISRNSPNYLAQLTADELKRDEVAYAGAIAAWKEAGYNATDYGPGFVLEDFGDRTHLASKGGAKLAKWLAPQIRDMSDKLGYQPKTNPVR